MDAKLKADWVKALRSGEYRQARRALRRGKSFCCLGVLCDVLGAEWDSGKDTDLAEWDSGKDTDLNATVNGERQSYYLSPVALASCGMTDQQQEILYGMNDDFERSFPEIADYIEQNL